MTETIKLQVQGREFDTLSEISKSYGIKYPTLYKRYFHGKRGDDLVKGFEYAPVNNYQRKRGKKAKRIEVNGELYTIDELASKYNIKKATVETRLHRGLKGEDLIAPLKRRRSIMIDGVIYQSLKELAEAYNVPYTTIKGRRSLGYDGKSLVKSENLTKNRVYEPQVIFGVTYQSFRSITDFWDEKEITLRKRYARGLRNERLIYPKGAPDNIFFNQSKKSFIYSKYFNGKRHEWSRKNIKEIVTVKNEVEKYFNQHGIVPIISDAHADIDYKSALPIGATIGEWTVIDFTTKSKRLYVVCRCSCREIKTVNASTLYKQKSLSCGHGLVDKMRSVDYQNKAKQAQRKRKEPNENNKLGERYITLDKRRRYNVNITRYGVKVRRRFYDLSEAIDFRDKLVEDIDNNDGKIPPEYQKETKK